jgi:hypothetical protein
MRDQQTIAQAVERFRDLGAAGWKRWQDQVHRTGGCRRPVRLRGRTWKPDGTEVYSTEAEPDAVLMVRCGNRREAICPSCAHEYRGDMYHLIRPGMVGGKGVSEQVTRRPKVFATLTAPSFGKVHSRDADGRRRCACGAFHEADDPELGAPLDPEGHDWVGQVIWNACSSELWRRVQITLVRLLAARMHIPERVWRILYRLSFAKVAEFQARGAVHFHAIIRIDRQVSFAPEPITLPDLCALIRQAAAAVEVTVPTPDGESLLLRFGEQAHARLLLAGADAHEDSEVSPEQVAGYVAKYSSKGSHEAITARGATAPAMRAGGVPDHLVRLVLTAREIGRAGAQWVTVGRWAQMLGSRMITAPGASGKVMREGTALVLVGRELARLGAWWERIGHWSHMLGFRGHFVTKSRAYSTTLGALRQARADFRAAQAGEDRTIPVLSEWEYAGSGYLNAGEALIAAGIEARLREMREAIAIERARDPAQFERPPDLDEAW